MNQLHFHVWVSQTIGIHGAQVMSLPHWQGQTAHKSTDRYTLPEVDGSHTHTISTPTMAKHLMMLFNQDTKEMLQKN